jgi:hypothetical protein
MHLQRPRAERLGDVAFFAVFLVYVWVGLDTRLIYHWQGPVFSTIPGFLDDFLKYPGGPADYLYALIAQAYASRGWGAIVLTAQVAAVAALTEVYFATLAGHALRLVRFVPAALLLYHANLYYDRTPIELALLLGLAPAILFVRLSRRWRSETALLGLFVALLGAAYYLGGMALVFFAPAAVFAHMARRPRPPLWIVYALVAAALPATELFHWIYMPSSAREWFAPPDSRLAIVCWGLYAFLTLGAAILLLRRPRSLSQKRRLVPLAAVLWTALPLLGLVAVAAISYRLNSRDRVLTALDYYTLSEDWPAVIDTSRRLATEDFKSLTRYEINLALHETNRLGDEMFRFPQAGPMLPVLRSEAFLPYTVRVADLCLRLGRVNEAEHLGSEARTRVNSDPRICRLMARINLVKGQTAAARKFLTVLSYDLVSGGWARQVLRELDQDPQLQGDPQVQLLRGRMLRNEDMFPVWQRADRAGADMERLLLDQLEQDPSNRMAFEFLMGGYLLARDGAAVSALMPRIKHMSGPAYVAPGGQRRTPRYYQEAMAIYADMTGRTVAIDGFEIQPETLHRLDAFKRIVAQATSKAAAMQAAWEGFRDTYFFYAYFGPGDYR